jgi:hypothetical protein
MHVDSARHVVVVAAAGRTLRVKPRQPESPRPRGHGGEADLEPSLARQRQGLRPRKLLRRERRPRRRAAAAGHRQHPAPLPRQQLGIAPAASSPARGLHLPQRPQPLPQRSEKVEKYSRSGQGVIIVVVVVVVIVVWLTCGLGGSGICSNEAAPQQHSSHQLRATPRSLASAHLAATAPPRSSRRSIVTLGCSQNG